MLDYFDTDLIFNNLYIIIFSKSSNLIESITKRKEISSNDTCKIIDANNISDLFANLMLYKNFNKIVVIDTLFIKIDQEIYQIKEKLQQDNTPFILLLMHHKKNILLNKKIYNFQVAEYPLSSTDLYLKIIDVLFFYKRESEMKILLEKSKKYDIVLNKYYSKEIIDIILNEDEQEVNLHDAKTEGTMLFFDIRNSTLISENLEPQIFASFLNEIFTDIIDLIYGHRGSVNKIVGDGIFATFGCPVFFEGYTQQAVKCALEIAKYLKTFNEFKPPYLQDDIGFGIGIATGSVFSGLIGSVRRKEYTVLGETVNQAAAIEKMTKQTNSKILFDENTKNIIQEIYPIKRLNREIINKNRRTFLYSVEEIKT